ncbi:MAG: P-II family nitrogen regulator [Firmicutes bacterium]|nr:P-II family nitrogen regulator [Bacillota bacterium]
MSPAYEQDLIVTIIKKGYSEEIIAASKKAGAEGATIMFGRGTSIHEQKKILGIPIEPEKEIVFTVVPQVISEKVLSAIVKAGKLERPATGIAFILELKKVAGVAHLLQEQNSPGD